MINLAMVVEYDGSKLFGFQKQKPPFRTIQDELEKALSKFAGHPVNIVTAGRTDAGVHASFQVINFTTTAQREMHGWIRATNSFLPSDIVVHEVVQVPDAFDARFAARSRTYHYYLLIDTVRPALSAGRVGFCCVTKMLEVAQMQAAGRCLLGKNDFSSFRASDCQANTPVRTMLHFDIVQINDKLLRFEFTANAFLYHMVRNIVGALIFVGKDKLSVSGFQDLLAAKNRKIAPPTFMPDGLYLTNVAYAEKYFSYTPASIYLAAI